MGLGFLTWYGYANYRKLTNKADLLSLEKQDLEDQIGKITSEFETLKNEDQYLRNEALQTQICQIEDVYQEAVSVYENLLSLEEMSDQTQNQQEDFADVLSLLGERNYASASADLKTLNAQINKEKEKIAAAFIIPKNAPVETNPPDSGYRRQQVVSDIGTFLVDIISADLNSTRVIVDTASETDCFNNCPTLPLATYVSRSGAFAGINGAYFCPAEYPSCAGKTNSFDTLLMNKNKYYFNSDNNVYSTVPAVAFYGHTARFMTQSLQWGRDTSVDAVIANYPLLTFNSQLYFTGGGDEKQGVKSGRSFVGASGSLVYLGVVHNATVAESARVLHTLGIQNALNLDSGGSTALWYGGYKVGPGRNLANALLLVRN